MTTFLATNIIASFELYFLIAVATEIFDDQFAADTDLSGATGCDGEILRGIKCLGLLGGDLVLLARHDFVLARMLFGFYYGCYLSQWRSVL